MECARAPHNIINEVMTGSPSEAFLLHAGARQQNRCAQAIHEGRGQVLSCLRPPHGDPEGPGPCELLLSPRQPRPEETTWGF